MRTASRIAKLCLILAVFFASPTLNAQDVMDPNDELVIYNPAAPPAAPNPNQMTKWVKTNRLGWNTSSFKSYIYQGMQFRLKFPKSYQHGVADGKRYPILAFFHGVGEKGTIYDNEYQLYHGGELHRNAVDQDKFDGFLLYPQSNEDNGVWNNAKLDIVMRIIRDYICVYNKGDIFRISVNGLSGGGEASWLFAINYPILTASTTPISAPIGRPRPNVARPNLKFTPIWLFQGGRDQAPLPVTTEDIVGDYNQQGANITYRLYPNEGHGCWYSAWNEPNYFPFLSQAHKANPWVLFRRTEFCPGDNINVTMGVTPGFQAYQWRKDTVLIPNATTNQYTATSLGSYSCRVRYGANQWSEWSPIPAVISHKAPTIPPIITPEGIVSNHLPALDGKTSTVLGVPAGYFTYLWQREGSSTTLSTTRTLVAPQPGDYKVRVTEEFGCQTEFSVPFRVVNANGPNPPSAPSNLMATTASKTAVRLDWIDNPAAPVDETAFEVYYSTNPGGPFTFHGFVPANTYTTTINNLIPNTRYYFKLRSISATAASPASNMPNAITQADVQPPTAPRTLAITSTDSTSIGLSWAASTDDVAVIKYEVFVNGVLTYNVPVGTHTITAYNLDYGQSYVFTVRARDAANNASPFSNQVSGQPIVASLKYKHYITTQGWSVLPNFSTLTPVTEGYMNNVLITPRRQNDDFAFLWEGLLSIPEDGVYTFRTNSDDGSKMWLGQLGQRSSPYSFAGAATVDNDGLHGTQNRESVPLTLTKGTYSVAFAFFEAGGGESMTVSWTTPRNANFVAIPDTAFGERKFNNGLPPEKPETLAAVGITYSKINLTWQDMSSNESGFEIWRSTSPTVSTFAIVKTVPANTTAYSDSGLAGNTRYYYRIRAINQYGESAYDKTSSFVEARTLALPAVPARPTNLLATGVSSSRINVAWNDVATTETGYEVYRSAINNSNFLLVATLPANSTSYIDNNLYVNSVFYYRVRALNAGGFSTYSNEDSARTFYTGTRITAVTNQFVPAGTTYEVPIEAVSAQGGTITFTFTNLPAFAGFVPQSNGKGKLVFNATAGQINSYPEIKIVARDENNLADSTIFDLVVNTNQHPSLSTVANVVLREKETTQINLTATDDESIFNWNFVNVPVFATVNQTGGQATIDLAPGYADVGQYRLNVRVEDAQNGFDTTSILITIVDVDPVTVVRVSFTDGTFMAPAPWNNTGKLPAAFDYFGNLKDQTGTNTPIGVRLMSAWSGSNNLGANTGNNSGIYPDPVLRSSYFTNSNRLIMFDGLAPNGQYNLTFSGSRANPNAGLNVVTRYTVGSTTVSLDAANNESEAVTVSGAVANASGQISAAVVNAPGSVYGYLNSVVLTNVFEDNTPPAAPRNLKATKGTDAVELTWTDAAYNETAYQVYRSTSAAGTYVLLNPGGNNPNLTSYADRTVTATTVYYYRVRTINSFGVSPYSEVVSSAPNLSPKLDSIPDLVMTVNQSFTQRVTAYDPGDLITLSVSNLPAFASFEDLGNGVGTIRINANATEAIYKNIAVTATDDLGASTTRVFTLIVDRLGLKRTYVNFNQSFPAKRPWNNTNASPTENLVISNLNDQVNAASGISVTLLDAWTSANTIGVVTGDSSGIYPDDVMRTFYSFNGADARRIKLSGLDTAKQYDLSFFASRGDYDEPLLTRYAVGEMSTALNATNNSSNIVKLTGLRPNEDGEIMFTSTREPGSFAAMLGALVIESYPVTDLQPAAPAGLTATGIAIDRIRLNWQAVSGATGYELWRANTAQGEYSKIADLASGVLTYTDQGLPMATTYYYKVRGLLAGGNFTKLSNYAAGGTMQFEIKLNLNDGSETSPPQGGNWNNTNALLDLDFKMNNLISTDGTGTGITWQLLKLFSGYNTLGATTGNNSGVVPDNVMRSFYYTNLADTARVRVGGLSQNATYTFTFFGSRGNPNAGVNVTSAYRIGSTVVTLNAANNTQNTVQIANVRPDEFGNVDITVYGVNGFGYLGAMFIQGSQSFVETSYLRRAPRTLFTTTSLSDTKLRPVSDEGQDGGSDLEKTLRTFPNPFTDDLSVKFDMPENVRNFTIRLLDLNGKTVFTKAYGQAPRGNWQQALGLEGRLLKPGTYILEIDGLGTQKRISQKIIKSSSAN